MIAKFINWLFPPRRMGWANAHRIADDHAAEVSQIHTQAYANVAHERRISK